MAAFSGSTLPAGWLLCDGSAVSRETYAALFSIIGTTYGAGDESTTFNLPNLIDKFVEGSATSGTVKSAGLPNITGRTENTTWNKNGIQGSSGAIYTEGAQFSYGSAGGSNPSFAVLFDASRSSSIYGNSTTVQPPAVAMQYAIYSGIVGKKLWLRTI